MNIRKIIQNNQNYYEINREERNYAAIFFAVLCKEGNLEKFLQLCKIDSPIDKENYGIYFEYSYLRDLWFSIGKKEKKPETNEEKKRYIEATNNVKKDIIRNKLFIKDIESILCKPVKDINKQFGVGGVPSDEYIQYPGKWAITKFADNFDNDDFLNVCMFKWSFNIKPDIVIQLSENRAVCIEAKYESGIGQYPSNEKDINLFDKKVNNRVTQTDLQKYMMQDLLDIKTDFRTLVKKRTNNETHQDILWSEAFDYMDLSGLPNFALNMIENAKRT